MKLVLNALIAILFTGCAGSTESVSVSIRPANYRQLIAEYLPDIKGVSLVGAEISVLSPSVGSQWGDWVTCLKAFGGRRPRFFAIFFSEKPPQSSATTKEAGENPYLIEARESVVTDRCETAVYSPLPSKKFKSKNAIPNEKQRR